MQFLRGFIHLRVEQPTRKTVTLKHGKKSFVNGKKSFSFKIKQTPWTMNLFLIVFDAVDMFQSNIGTLPQLRMFFEL